MVARASEVKVIICLPGSSLEEYVQIVEQNYQTNCLNPRVFLTVLVANVPHGD